MTVLAAHAWSSNAHMIRDAVVPLGYLREDDDVLDPTYGNGTWWNLWRPHNLYASDIDLDRSPCGLSVDFRSLPSPDESFDAVVFDPPYVSIGGRTTSGIPEFHERFGMTDAPLSPEGVQDLINAGLAECKRVLARGGNLLVKCQDYISSGQFWPGTYYTTTEAILLGLKLVDRLEHLARRPRPQPSGRRQVHARRNLSTLLVFEK